MLKKNIYIIKFIMIVALFYSCSSSNLTNKDKIIVFENENYQIQYPNNWKVYKDSYVHKCIEFVFSLSYKNEVIPEFSQYLLIEYSIINNEVRQITYRSTTNNYSYYSKDASFIIDSVKYKN